MRRTVKCYSAPPAEAGLVVVFLSVLLMWCNVVVVNLAIVDMVHEPPDPFCAAASNTSLRIPPIAGGRTRWSEYEQSFVLSACYLGVTVMLFPAVWLYWISSSKIVLMISTLALGVATLAYPVLAQLHWTAATAVRFLSGCCYSLLDQSAKMLLRNCTRSVTKLQIVEFFGVYLGVICGYAITGVVLFWFRNWTLPFYFWGCFHCVWCLVVYVYMEEGGLLNPAASLSFVALHETQPIYRSIIASRAVWAIVTARMGGNVVLYMMITYLPKYYANILNFNITENTLALSASFALMFCLTYYSLRFSKWLVENNNWNRALVRKTHVLISSLMIFLLLAAANMHGCNKVLAVTLFSLAIYFMGVYDIILIANIHDLTTDYYMFVAALADSFGSFAAFVSNVAIGFMTEQNTSTEWRVVIWVYLAFQNLCALVYCCMGSSKRATWDYQRKGTESPPAGKVKWYLEMHPDEFNEKKRLKARTSDTF